MLPWGSYSPDLIQTKSPPNGSNLQKLLTGECFLFLSVAGIRYPYQRNFRSIGGWKAPLRHHLAWPRECSERERCWVLAKTCTQLFSCCSLNCTSGPGGLGHLCLEGQRQTGVLRDSRFSSQALRFAVEMP